MRFVSSEQFFVSVFWSFSVSHKVKLEQTQIYRKTCYYRVFFFVVNICVGRDQFFPLQVGTSSKC